MLENISLDIFILDYFIPFILTFSIFYIILHQLKVFGEPTSSLTRKVNLIVSLAISFLVVAYNPLGISFSQFLSQLFLGTTILILAMVLLIFFSAMLAMAMGIKGGHWLTFLIAVGMVIYLFASTGITSKLPTVSQMGLNLDYTILGIIGVMAVVFFFVWWMVR